MGVLTNSFCASGMHLPNGSYATFGGNNAVSIGPFIPFSHVYLWKRDPSLFKRLWRTFFTDFRRRLRRL